MSKKLVLLAGPTASGKSNLAIKLAKKLKDVIICCDSQEVLKIAKKYKAKAILTSKKHKCGTDRIYEGLKKIKKKYDQIIDIQGDETLIDPKNIDKVVEFHRRCSNSDIILPNLLSNIASLSFIIDGFNLFWKPTAHIKLFFFDISYSFFESE